MASLDDAEKVWELEVYMFPDHVDNQIGVYAVNEDPDAEMFDRTKDLVGEGDTVLAAIADVASSNGGKDAE